MTQVTILPLPPVPSVQTFVSRDGLLTQPVQQWLVELREKVNQINNVIVAISGSGSTSAAFDLLSPLTTKGDLLTYNGSHNVREAVGTDGYFLVADSTSPTGVSWKNVASTGAQPFIIPGTIQQYWRGDKTWQDFDTDVRATTLTGLSTTNSTPIIATDTVLTAEGKLQAQISLVLNDLIVSSSGNPLVTSGGDFITTSAA